MKCPVHTKYFDDSCSICKQEYKELKSDSKIHNVSGNKYKEFTEERAKKLYEELLLQYLKYGSNAADADQKAKAIIKKQCTMRRQPFWTWL